MKLRVKKSQLLVLLVLFLLVAIPPLLMNGASIPGLATQATAKPFTHMLSSGLFLLPPNAASVDWAVVNNSHRAQTFRVTVFKGAVGVPKTAIDPGALEFTIDPSVVTHNANSVCADCPFVLGFYYEVVVETDSLDLLPSVTVWSDNLGSAYIAGTLIPPGDFVRVR